jgi:hypothetical protein
VGPSPARDARSQDFIELFFESKSLLPPNFHVYLRVQQASIEPIRAAAFHIFAVDSTAGFHPSAGSYSPVQGHGEAWALFGARVGVLIGACESEIHQDSRYGLGCSVCLGKPPNQSIMAQQRR